MKSPSRALARALPEGSAGTTELRVGVKGAETQVSFENVGAGTYAVSCMRC